ncbi:MAG: hypothetical protein J6Y69_05155 [Treponema sp.]|nr:hypothetical protein [Treponema sp.]
MSRRKYILFMIILLASAVASSYAAVISFQVIQHDDTQKEVRASSYVIENALFDYFFDKGFIVTNSPAASSEDEYEDKTIYYRSMAEAKLGRCKWFVVILTDYQAGISPNPGGIYLSHIKKVDWTVYDASTGAKISSGTKAPEKISDRLDNEHGISSFMAEVAQDIYRTVQ